MMEQPPSLPSGSWEQAVAFASGREGEYAYHPRSVIVRGEAALSRLGELTRIAPLRVDEDKDGYLVIEFAEGIEVGDIVDRLREEGLQAQPNHVFFAHCQCGGCGPHPAALAGNPLYANPLYANPLYANPLYANPLYANPLYANPLYANPAGQSPFTANPLYANEYRATGKRKSSAVPASPQPDPPPLPPGGPTIWVLDSGLAINEQPPSAPSDPNAPSTRQLPPLLERLDAATAAYDRDGPDMDNDSNLDPVAGHGTFIAGLIEQLIPARKLCLGKVLETTGEGNEATIGKRIDEIVAAVTGGSGEPTEESSRTIVNLSLGGYFLENSTYLPRKVKNAQRAGIVIVASAGNDGSCRPTYPAALPGVVSVGALGPDGPAPFSNYGPWVRACAPGVGLISSFFRQFNGPLSPGASGQDPDLFQSWARWSGTSFSGPVVAAALAREMVLTGCTGTEAVARVIDAPGLYRIPGLGTVVNLA